MKILICDASVVLKWFKSEAEENITQAKQILQVLHKGTIALFEPELVLLETANILTLNKNWPEEKITEALSFLANLDWKLVGLKDKLLNVATNLARKHGITIYDALYLALAHTVNGILVSDDHKHHGKIKSKLVVMLKDWKMSS